MSKAHVHCPNCGSHRIYATDGTLSMHTAYLHGEEFRQISEEGKDCPYVETEANYPIKCVDCGEENSVVGRIVYEKRFEQALDYIDALVKQIRKYSSNEYIENPVIGYISLSKIEEFLNDNK